MHSAIQATRNKQAVVGKQTQRRPRKGKQKQLQAFSDTLLTIFTQRRDVAANSTTRLR
jgi:hypothetical protein